MKKQLAIYVLLALILTIGSLTASASTELPELPPYNIYRAGGTPGTQSSPQLDYSITVQTGEALQIQYLVPGAEHCSSIRLHILLDGVEVAVTPWLGWPGHTDVGPLDTGILDLGPVSPGSHSVTLSPEGQVGGCNSGWVYSWAGTLKVWVSLFDVTFTYSPDEPVADSLEPVIFDASESQIPDRATATFEWDFGDKTPPEQGEIITHIFSTEGQYTVTLTVRDSGGQELGSSSQDVEVGPPVCIPLGVTLAGAKRDVIFVPNEDYRGKGDLGGFLSDAGRKIHVRLGGVSPITGNLDKFNFYYTTSAGHAKPSNPGRRSSLPKGLLKECRFAEAIVVLHTAYFGDAAGKSIPRIYTAEGPARYDSTGSFIHESGHGLFGLADEYDKTKTYYQPSPWPNIWPTKAECRADAAAMSWNPAYCQQFTAKQGGWWKFGDDYIMESGVHFARGFGKAGERRIHWVFDSLSIPIPVAQPVPSPERAMFFEMSIDDGEMIVQESAVVDGSPPDYLPGEYSFTARLFSGDQELLGEYGFGDPRAIQGEPGYDGPTWLDSVDFVLILPHFHNVGHLEIVSSATNEPVIVVDVGQYAIAGGPLAHAGGPYVGSEGASIAFDASPSIDLDGQIVLYEWDFDGDGISDVSSTDPTTSFAWDDEFAGVVFLRVTDNEGLTDVDTAKVTVYNVAPAVGTISAPVDPVPVNASISASADFSDPGVLDTHSAVWDWGDGTTTVQALAVSPVSASHIYREPGMYEIHLTVTDSDSGLATSVYQYIVVYDPDGGFVTGGGWIDSPEGSYVPDPSLTGKASFGFVSKYKKGADVPTGQTEFQFKVADLNFRTSSYDWLVIAGAKATFKGTGTINGIGNYGFLLSAIDEKLTPSSDVDLFRIKIWDKETKELVYDNQVGDGDDAEPATEIGGGSIVIHE